MAREGANYALCPPYRFTNMRRNIIVIVLVVILVLFLLTIAKSYEASKSPSKTRKLSPTQLKQEIASKTVEEIIKEDIERIAVVRVSDTPSHKAVQEYIISQFQGTKFTIEKDVFRDNTPLGEKEFTNIIATYNPNAEHFLVLAAHYDSKYFPTFNFVGATDSAVPCAMLLDIARNLNPLLARVKPGWGLRLIFFDGEEAFQHWTRTDSLYGSRHLAAKWENTLTADGKSILSTIGVFVLLDLIGAPNPAFYSTFSQTDTIFDRFVNIERRLKELKIIQSEAPTYFKTQRFHNAGVDDDHRPFLERGVPIVHLIPTPFPQVWHKEIDDVAHLHFPTILDLVTIIRTFTAEYLLNDLNR